MDEFGSVNTFWRSLFICVRVCVVVMSHVCVPFQISSSVCVCISIINPRRACARVTVVVLCVCVCVCVSVHGSNLLVAQLRDKLVILTGSVSWSLQN